MAAGQARLLSITSRMSDNELRAQIINNNKMRLATESSQVSERYIAALNEAQLMYTSYDADNNASYQQLTFNAMTSYNEFNNQYALTNSSGQVLLSEKDSINYKKSNGNLETFLGLYGLEKSTSYWDNLGSVDFSQINNNLKAISGTDVLQKLYEGWKGTDNDFKIGNLSIAKRNSYDAVASGDTMYQYDKALMNYETAYSDYIGLISDAMKNKLLGLMYDNGLKNGSDAYASLSALKTAYKDPSKSASDLKDAFGKLANMVGSASFKNLLPSTYPPETGTYLNNLVSNLNNLKAGQISYDVDDIETTQPDHDGYWITEDTSSGSSVHKLNYKFTGNGTTSEGSNIEKNGTVTIEGTSYTLTDITYNSTNKNYKITLARTIGEDELREQFQSTIDTLEKFIMNNWDTSPSKWTGAVTDGAGSTTVENTILNNAYNAYTEAAKTLGKIIFGEGYNSSTCPYDDLDDLSKLYEKASNFTYGFKQVFCNLLLDMVMDTYGEPKYTWIDTNPNTNTNGEAKAQWYTNLFNLAQKNGYKTILDGLASSSEWIRFAFESGIANLQQVDVGNNWNPLIYSNCSDITEQTNDKAIAIAEAEYNAAMNKIENKDKRYDLELKNIDTEHNSLQTEYDSIKAAIDKNVERTFKLYS